MTEQLSRLSVIIVNWNTRPLLKQCLDTVFATLDSPDVWVVDNASQDDSLALLETQFPLVHCIANRSNVGFATANNQALERCGGDFALLLNSDALLLPEAGARLLGAIQSHPQTAAVAPMLINPDGSFQAGPNDDLGLVSETLLLLGMQRFLRSGYYPGYAPGAPAGVYAWVGGTCLLLRRAAWEAIGKFDPSFFMYSEEADWCYRARAGGWQVRYEPTAQAVHLGGGSSRHAAAAMRAQLYKSKLLFFAKHKPAPQTAVLRSLILGTSALKAAAYDALALVRRDQSAALRDRAASFRLVYRTIKAMPSEPRRLSPVTS